MFGKKKTSSPAKISSLVGAQTEISGDVNFSNGLHIDGTVKGNVVADIDADALLIIAETGVIQGEVRAPFIVISGTVDGDVHSSERLELTSKARIKGNVYYNLVEMSIGAEVNGNLIHYTGSKPVLPKEGRAVARPGGSGGGAVTEGAPKPEARPAQQPNKSGAFGHGF